MKIDFVSDVVCPWCAIGLHALEIALARLDPAQAVTLSFHPFELNPDLGPEGEDLAAHLARKYGATPAQLAQTHETIRQRGAEVGFSFDLERRTRIVNTFDAHRLLHWAGLEGRQRELKHALLQAYFTDGENPGDRSVLQRLATEVGLHGQRAREVLASGEFGPQVRAAERRVQALGIHAVPAVIIDDRHLISGGQPVAVYEQALRRLLAAPAAGASEPGAG
ncbi:DsbA family oxidoreductase [Piscinibacter sakaiensis]|uniref:2-hydroxychromene-2-carboxylate isomerase n=1 Tax=Piscinibacter sakaiensis TaxID=1547922 RepID=A0A0K8NVS7_PISS1|nr:DsbA family oxidoreductase [Piscinibacter sakaiensis]GAP34483.1 2-hydroxychromene-2-carboxylate isomerase [Piscinibacter sakaiensis]